MDKQVIDRRKVRDMIIEIITANPDAVNPHVNEDGDYSCKYIAADPSAPVKHCVIGQFLANLGLADELPLPEPDEFGEIYNPTASALLRALSDSRDVPFIFTDDAVTLADAVQTCADGSGRAPRKWSEILSLPGLTEESV